MHLFYFSVRSRNINFHGIGDRHARDHGEKLRGEHLNRSSHPPSFVYIPTDALSFCQFPSKFFLNIYFWPRAWLDSTVLKEACSSGPELNLIQPLFTFLDALFFSIPKSVFYPFIFDHELDISKGFFDRKIGLIQQSWKKLVLQDLN